jgi:hypothetical protein
MLAPLPARYRHLVAATVLLIGMAIGAWVAYTVPAWATGAGVLLGALVGLLAAYALVHDFSRPRTVRVTHRR